MARELFRKASLERLTSPDQLNQRMQVVSFKTWIALATIGALLICVLFWSIFGQIPVIIQGKGIVFDPLRTVLVRSEISGIVAEFHLGASAHVEKGTLIMTLHNPQIAADLKEKELLISSLETIQSEEARKEVLLEKAKVEALKQLQENERIVAPEAGTLVNVNISSQGLVSPGTNLAWIEKERVEGQLQRIFAIFSYETGESIRPGMQVEMALASVNWQAHGLLLGRVLKVFPYFTSFDQGPFRFLPSPELKEYLTGRGTQSGIIVEIEPTKDSHTISGYKWSSKNGPPFPIEEGTVGVTKVLLETRRPISYLIPVR